VLHPAPVHHLDFLDVLGILLGILFTIAKLDAQGRKATDFPHVAATDFQRWQTWTTSIYRIGAAACFFRVLFHQGWALYTGRHLPSALVAPLGLRLPALLVDLLFLAALIATFVRSGRARTLRRELGIVLSPVPAPSPAAGEDDAKDTDKS